jgi:hypothetical protein
MTTQGIHRSSSNSKQGRRMYNIARQPEGKLTAEQIAWNKAVDEKKAARKAPKQVDPNAWAMERGLESF